MKIGFVTLLALSMLQLYPPPFPREGVTKILENEYVVVWDGRFPKNRPTAMHEHKFDLVGVFFSEGQVRTTMLDGSVREGQPFNAGNVVFQPRGVIHIEESLVANTRVIGVELKDVSSAPSQNVPSQLDPVKLASHVYRPLLDNDRVRIMEAVARPNESRPRHAHPGRLILQERDCPGDPPPPSASTTADGLRVWWVDAGIHEPGTSTSPEECRRHEVELKGAQGPVQQPFL